MILPNCGISSQEAFLHSFDLANDRRVSVTEAEVYIRGWKEKVAGEESDGNSGWLRDNLLLAWLRGGACYSSRSCTNTRQHSTEARTNTVGK